MVFLKKWIPQNIIIFLLGIIAGSQIEIFNGLYLAHFVILILFTFYVKFNKSDIYLYSIFAFFCLISTVYNYIIYDSSNFKISNMLNTIFLYSTLLITISYAQFCDLFKGYFIVFIFQLILVLFNFKLSLLNNGFIWFFTNEREWMDGYNFFGNSFAVLGVMLAYINYKLYNKNIFVYFILCSVLILTTSRLSLFGILFGLIFLVKQYIWKYRFVKIVILLTIPVILIQLLRFNYKELEGFETLSNRLTYSDDRNNLAEISKMLFYKHPIMGNGPIFIEKYTLWEPHLHNIWFDVIVGYGVFSFSLFFLLFFKKVKAYFHSTHDYLFILFILLCSISQISIKAPFIGLILFSYLNLYSKHNFGNSKIK